MLFSRVPYIILIVFFLPDVKTSEIKRVSDQQQVKHGMTIGHNIQGIGLHFEAVHILGPVVALLAFYFLESAEPTSPLDLKIDPSDDLFTTDDMFIRSNDVFDTTRRIQRWDPTVIESDILPRYPNQIPEVGNGHLATVILGDAIFMNGLYNGANITSHRARIPSTVAYMCYGLPPHYETTYRLDMGKGIFTETHSGDGVTITLSTFAHRVWTGVLVNLLTISREDIAQQAEVFVHHVRSLPSEDIDFYKEEGGLLRGETKEAEYPDLATTITFFMKTTRSLAGHHIIKPGNKSLSMAAFTVIDVNKEKVLVEYEEAKKAFENSMLVSAHVKEWEAIWNKGRIDVEGNITLSRINYAAMYYLLSSLPFAGNRQDWPFIGLSPGGLAHGDQDRDYMGHVFWDQDTWMSPGLALFYPDIGQLLVKTRSRTFNAATLLANTTGYKGARYPWESAYTGLEVCPGRIYSDLEIHVTADVVMMMRQYWYLTNDVTFFLDHRGFDVVAGVAEFFASRVVYDTDSDIYRILDVMPPDEYHFHVNDSVYTNAIVKSALEFANQLARDLGKPENSTWARIADKMLILYDPELDYNPEYEGYQVGLYTKQADVIMLPFPLMMSVNGSTMTNNLMFYEKTWTENSDGTGATNFLTGMGGHLQTLLFGYGGCRLYKDRITFNPKMIPSTTSATFTGIDYMNCSFTIHYTYYDVELTLVWVGAGSRGLDIKFSHQMMWQKLDVDKTVAFRRQAFQIKPAA